MLTISCAGSSSKGNAYKIDDGNTFLLIEAGVRLAVARQTFGFNLSCAVGCLISHSHGDHVKYAGEIMRKLGVEVYASKETFESIGGLNGHCVNHIKAKQRINIHGWRVLPFATEHDCPGSLGFFIQSKDGENLLFATDTAYIRHRFVDINYLMIEANFSNEILESNIANGSIDPGRRKRLLESHFSFDRVKEFIKKNDMSKLRSVHLLHLSSENSDEAQFKQEIQQITGVPVYVCGE